MAVMKSLMAEARIRPRTGWVRADQARSAEDDQRERELRDELNEANKYIEQLERTLRDRAVLVDELPRDQLAQGDDIVEITITFTDKSKTVVSKNIGLTWDEIFKVVGPTMYGYIMRRREKGYNQEPTILSKIISKIISGQKLSIRYKIEKSKYNKVKLMHAYCSSKSLDWWSSLRTVRKMDGCFGA